MDYQFNFNFCVQWLPEEFLPYLEQWRNSVQKRAGFSEKAKQMMLLAKETRDGITVTGKYINCMFSFINLSNLQSNHFWS